MKRIRIIATMVLACVLSMTVQAQKIGLEVGNIAPELIYNNPDGRAVSLSSLRGKMVLVDFWASWCGPCRAENPTVVSAYREFKDKKFVKGDGFTVYSVSLDNNKPRWVSAIASDSLSWSSHVCDFGGWHSKAAAKYGVHSIPTNYLIDGDGVIVAKNLRGVALRAVLMQHLAK